jgi:predicted nucleic acid-binding protein
MAMPPRWLQERSPISVEPIPLLDDGEAAAISLALELKADLLLIDETKGRKAATERHIRLTGTLGVVQRASKSGFVKLEDAFQRLRGLVFGSQRHSWMSC